MSVTTKAVLTRFGKVKAMLVAGVLAATVSVVLAPAATASPGTERAQAVTQVVSIDPLKLAVPEKVYEVFVCAMCTANQVNTLDQVATGQVAQIAGR